MATRGYLTCYNILQAMGWSAALAATLRSIVKNAGSFSSVYTEAGWYVRAFQVASVLEVFHGVFKLTKSPVSSALMQWAGRTHVLMAVTHAIPELHSNPAVGVLFLAWAITEVIRYPTYALSEDCPRWLTWLRYNIFIPMYPIGFLSEMKLMFDGLSIMRTEQLYTVTMPNIYNFAFDYPTFIVGLLLAYPLFGYSLYVYMLAQRKKKLAPGEAKKKD